MEGEVFDSLVRRFVAARSRRQALAALGGTALAVLGLRQAAAQDVGVLGCRSRLQHCEETEDCCGFDSPRPIQCERVSRRCDKSIRGKRCCGGRRAKCGDDCDCCRGLRCRGAHCRR